MGSNDNNVYAIDTGTGDVAKKASATDSATVAVGSSASNSKVVTVPFSSAEYNCPKKVDTKNWDTRGFDRHPDWFVVEQSGHQVTIRRGDSADGWGMDLVFKCTSTSKSTHGDVEAKASTSSGAANSAMIVAIIAAAVGVLILCIAKEARSNDSQQKEVDMPTATTATPVAESKEVDMRTATTATPVAPVY